MSVPKFLAFSGGALLSGAVVYSVPNIGNLVLWIISVALLLGAAVSIYRLMIWRIATSLLCGACIALLLAFFMDRFDIRYVWLYSSETLPSYLKLANLWGGDEGTVLLLATLLMPTALRYSSRPGFEGCSNALIAAWYVATAAWFGPFTATPGDWLLVKSSQGMNAHLQTFWMALHAPLILAAYAWALSPVGAASQALTRGESDYINVASTYSRRAWLVLTAGIGFGMIWALEDFTFGQLWHWDPVQTSVFVIWALLGAVLHGVPRLRQYGAFSCLLPSLSLLVAASTCMAMAVTRSDVLASSHRYIGTTSWLSHLGLSLLFLFAAIALPLRAWVKRASSTSLGRWGDWTSLLSVSGFVIMAFLAGVALLQAYVRQWSALDKRSDQMPFFETLSMWANAVELVQLRQAFAQWDVDGYALGHGLLPFVLALGLIGGFVFLRRALRHKHLAIIGTVLVSLMCLFLALHGGWLSNRYAGEGVLSQHIVKVLPWLDATLAAALFLLFSCCLWCVSSVWRSRRLGTLRLTGSLALIHGGAVLALVGGFAATTLNSYLPVLFKEGDDLSQWRTMSEGMQVRVSPALSLEDYSGYKAVANVELRYGQAEVYGRALFQDARALPPGYQGSVRQLCEILDYRYARHQGDPGYILNPFIIRGWLEDTQVWVPASPRLMGATESIKGEQRGDALVVVRRYPLVSLIWGGFVAMLLGVLLLPGRSREKVVWPRY